MLKSTERLNRDLFPKVAGARAIHTPLFTLRMTPSRTSGEKRCSIVVSKKVAKTAVERNLLRRRAYAALANIDIGSYYVIVYMKPESTLVPYDTLRDMLSSTFSTYRGN